MFRRGMTLSLVTLLAACAVGALSGTAQADHRKRRVIVEEEYYPGPPVIRHIPGLRILFGDYALTEEEFNALYGDPQQKFDESYYDPEPVFPAKPAGKKQKPAATDQQQTASAKKPPAASAALSCEKATSVVSGYGFSSVEAASCEGKVYAFNAKRDGKSFAIKLDPASGELTEVKKLP